MTLDELGDRLFASAPEAASVTGRDVRTIRRAIRAGEIPASPVGRKMMIPVSWIRAEAGVSGGTASEPDYDQLADRLIDRMCARSPRLALLLSLNDAQGMAV